MIQDQYFDTPIRTDETRLPLNSPPRRQPILRGLRHLLIGLAFAFLLNCLTVLLWMANPGNLFGTSSFPHTFIAFLMLPLHMPLLLFIPLFEILLGTWLAWAVAGPLALLAYLRVVSHEQEIYRARHTLLQSWSYPYDMPVLYTLDNPDPTRPAQVRELTPLALLETLQTAASPHLLLLGAPGSGKTLFVHEYLSTIALHRRRVAFGRFAVPLFVPLKYYALLLQASDLPVSAPFSLLDFCDACALPGLEHLRPYLNRLFRRGRLLFLCDGLDEVPAAYRQQLDRELIQLMRQERNGLLLTCTPDLYAQSGELARTSTANLVPRAVFPPLEQARVRGTVERFIVELDTKYHPHLPTAGQVMSMLEQTRLRWICATPLYLFALLASLETLPIEEAGRLDTRGRLLQHFLRQRLRDSVQMADDLLFLHALACVARWRGDSDLLVLPPESFLTLDMPEQALRDEQALQQVLVQWTREQQVYSPFVEQAVFSLAETLPADQPALILQRAYRAGLIDIDERGVLGFRHTLIVSALLAEFLASQLVRSPQADRGHAGETTLRLDEMEMLPDDLVAWSEPLALWAGLLTDPLAAADELAVYARAHVAQRQGALLIGLICLGIAQIPPAAPSASPPRVPPTLELALSEMLTDQAALAALADLWQECATQGAPELYQALFPLLLIDGSEAFLQLLDPALVADRFFQRLIECIDDPRQDLLVKRLVRALSSWGTAVVPRASWLCAAGNGASGRLRTAAINILGGTRTANALEPLMTCLYDAEPYIAQRASHALFRLGADLTLARLLREISRPVASSAPQSSRAPIFPLLERFLNEPNPARQLRPEQCEQIDAALLALLTTQTHVADLEKARALLVSQGRLAEERTSGKIALRMLVAQLSTPDDTLARSMTGALKDVGQVATPSLLEQLEQQSSPSERVRILEVLAAVHDERALPTLLSLLADNSPAVQQALAATLAVYTPRCIPGLIETILHHPDERAAVHAGQILGTQGLVVVEPVTKALTPPVAGRTLLLVKVLGRVGEVRAVPALIALLRETRADVELALALIQALGQFHDERVVHPLLGFLGGENVLLYEGALNALSGLGELACPALLLALDTDAQTPLIARIKRVLLGMQPFPGELLLRAVDESSEEQARHIAEIFQARGMDAAQVLANNLFHVRPRVCAWVRTVADEMDGHYLVPALLEVLNRPDPAWRELLATYLLKHPQEAIPPLVSLLDDPERYEPAAAILPRAGRAVLPALVPALDAPQDIVQARAMTVLETLLREQGASPDDAVQLLGLALPARAHAALVRILTGDLAELSLPALLAGLEDAHLLSEVSAVLLHLARRAAAWEATVLESLLQALRVRNRRHGSAVALVDLGSAAVAGVGALITDADEQVARVARQILGEIGAPAFPFLWAAYSDAGNPARGEAAREIFRSMPTPVIKDELVELLSSARREHISMALALLLERIHDENLQAGRAGEMLPALLAHVQSSGNEQANLRILALLLLLGGSLVAQPLVDALYANPRGHEHLIQAFLLLGQGVESHLQAVLRDKQAPVRLQAEAAGILAMYRAGQDVQDLALALSEHGLWAGRSAQQVTTVLQAPQLDISLRALGGLLVAGHWGTTELRELRAASKAGSAAREVFDILLGWRYSPQITNLQQELDLERQERRQEVLVHTQELLAMKAQTIDLEHDLEIMRKEQEEQHRGHEQKSKELQEIITSISQEKQQLQAELQQVTQEKLALASSAQQAGQEQARLQAEAQRWRTYSQQLERDLNALRRPGPIS